MDSDEEQGLRTFSVTVGCDLVRPQWVELDGVRTDVAEIESEWREEERHGYRVRLASGVHMLLYYVPELDLWSGVTEVRGFSEPGSAQRRPK